MPHPRPRLAVLAATALVALGAFGASSTLAFEIPPGDAPDPVETSNPRTDPGNVAVDARPDLDVVTAPPADAAPLDAAGLVETEPVDMTGLVVHTDERPDPPVEAAPLDPGAVVAHPEDAILVVDRPADPVDVVKPRGVDGTGACPSGGAPALTVRAKQTTITAPPGGGSQQVLEFVGQGFHPGATVTISLHNYPAADGSQTDVKLTATADAEGNLHWSIDLSQLPARNFAGEPDVDVWVTVTDGQGCAVIRRIKAGKLLSPAPA